MTFKNKQCRTVIKDLATYRDFDAVERSRIDMHLRRCESCRAAASEFELIENITFDDIDLDKEHQDNIYDRLVPAIHEITQAQIIPPTKVVWLKKASIGSAVISVAAALIFGVVLFRQPTNYNIADYSIPGQQSEATVASLMINSGRLDKIEGTVTIDGKPATEQNGVFDVESGTKISLNSESSVNFRIGNIAQIALVGETTWSVKEINDDKILLSLTHGKMATQFDGTLGRILEVHTPESVVRVKGTIFTVEVFDDGATQVSVTRGEVEVFSRSPQGTLSTITSVKKGRLLQVPGLGRTVKLGDSQRVLAQEVNILEDSPVASAGRMVTFSGNQEHVKIEVDGKVLGYSPISVRLPTGRVSYRLSKPGMKSVKSWLVNEQVSESIEFSLVPNDDYQPEVVSKSGISKGNKKWSLNHADIDVDKTSRGYIQRASAAMKSGDLAYAANLLEKVITKVSGDKLVTATSLLAECYSALGMYRKAADQFDKVANMTAGTSIAQNAKYEVGRLSMDHMGDYDRARNAFLSYVADPSSRQFQENAYFSLCEIYGREGYRKNAIGCFNDYLRTYPDGHRAAYSRLWRGVLYQETNQQWKKAERDLLAFIEAKPQHPRCEEARYRIALGRYHQKDYAGAMRMVREYNIEHPAGQYHIRMDRLQNAIMKNSHK